MEETLMAQIHLDDLTDEQQEAFVRGWDRAGGYVGDGESPSPWCCPWHSGKSVVLQSCSDNPEDWGAQYWQEVESEVLASIAEEETVRIEYIEDYAKEQLELELEYRLDRFSQEELKDGVAAEAYFSLDGVSAYTRTENSASLKMPESEKERNELLGRLVDEASERATFVVGTEKEARDLFDAKYGVFL